MRHLFVGVVWFIGIYGITYAACAILGIPW